jgi:hypothetical protein
LENKGPNDPGLAAPAARQPAGVSEKPRAWGLLCRRSIAVPTFRGWVVLVLSLGVLLVVFVRCLYPFLALNDPISGGFLVVEGWTPDYGMQLAIAEFKREHYQTIYVTGGPLERGMHLAAYQTYAQLGAATLVKLGLDSNVVQAVPAPVVRQDRTYSSAVSLKKWLLEHDLKPTRIQLLSEGPHARRSRLLYEKVMGEGVVIGVTSIPSREYDPKHWWRYSAGVRNVIDEAVAYLYARLLFSPSKE